MELRLHKVEKESEIIMKKLDKQLDKSIRNIAKNLSKFLKGSEVQERVSSWRLGNSCSLFVLTNMKYNSTLFWNHPQ